MSYDSAGGEDDAVVKDIGTRDTVFFEFSIRMDKIPRKSLQRR